MKHPIIICVAISLCACVSAPQGSYTPPSAANYSNTIMVEETVDATWDALVNYASQTFFAIDNFEKDSGLMTLSFGASNIADYVDCGDLQIDRPAFNGKYAEFIEHNSNAKLTGKMNLRVSAVDVGKTQVTVNARYVLNVPQSTSQVYNMWTGGYQFVSVPSTTWSFDSKTSDTRSVPNPLNGTNSGRTCRPTGHAEKSIIDGLDL